MSSDVFELFRNAECFQEDGYCEYTVGYFIGESTNFKNEALAKNDLKLAKAYDKQIDGNKAMDDYVISQGANPGEMILIGHGAY